jgi:hypothetical protein
MKRIIRNALIASAFIAPIPLVLGFLRATNPGFEPGVAGALVPLLLWLTLFQGLNTMSGNRKTVAIDGGAKTSALRFEAEAGRGRLVFLRTSLANPMVGFDIEVDGRPAAQLRPRQFAVVSVAVGTHTVFADIPSGEGESSVPPAKVEVAEGAVLFFRPKAKMDMFRTSLRLEPLPDTPALRATLAGLTLVEADATSPRAAQRAG